jgi:RNA polymerase sigma-70 factor (ECF subfamily)
MHAFQPRETPAGRPGDLDALAAAAAAGDAQATAALLQTVWPDAFRIAWSVLGERGAAEDAAQEACARVLTAIGTLRDVARFRPWFYRLVVNEAKSRLRNAARAVQQFEPRAVEIVTREEHIDLARALTALNPELRACVVLHYYAGLNGAQIAKVVNATPMAVRWRLFSARRRLRALLGNTAAPQHAHNNGRVCR